MYKINEYNNNNNNNNIRSDRLFEYDDLFIAFRFIQVVHKYNFSSIYYAEYFHVEPVMSLVDFNVKFFYTTYILVYWIRVHIPFV
jgi:hypothetical protein